MLWQLAILSSGVTIGYKWIYREDIKFKKRLMQICYRIDDFINRQGETLKLKKYEKTDTGHKALISIPFGIGFNQIEKRIDVLKTNFGAEELNLNMVHGLLEMEIIDCPLQDVEFEPVKTLEHELLFGYTHKEFKKVDLNKFPHVLIGGETGSGKSRLLLLALSNLINQHDNIDLYLTQIRKGDLSVFKDCRQVKYHAKDLEQAELMLEHINELCVDRDKELEKYIMDGIYNIGDYNTRFKNKMNYSYVVLDEFSFFIPNSTDSKESKNLKKNCLAYIKNIVLTGRSTGIFIITSLQKPTSSSIPSDIKSQLTTRISFKQLDDASSIVILGDGKATELKTREAVLRTLDEDIIKIPFIDHTLLMRAIKPKLEKNHEYLTLLGFTNKEIEEGNELPDVNFSE